MGKKTSCQYVPCICNPWTPHSTSPTHKIPSRQSWKFLIIKELITAEIQGDWNLNEFLNYHKERKRKTQQYPRRIIKRLEWRHKHSPRPLCMETFETIEMVGVCVTWMRTIESCYSVITSMLHLLSMYSTSPLSPHFSFLQHSVSKYKRVTWAQVFLHHRFFFLLFWKWDLKIIFARIDAVGTSQRLDHSCFELVRPII